MFEPGSRYENIETATLVVEDAEGRQRLIRYKRRRFIPSTEGNTTLLEHPVIQGDRLDNLTAHYLGDPLQFWQVCDANTTLNPQDLTAEVGRKILIAMPKFGP